MELYLTFTIIYALTDGLTVLSQYYESGPTPAVNAAITWDFKQRGSCILSLRLIGRKFSLADTTVTTRGGSDASILPPPVGTARTCRPPKARKCGYELLG